MPTPNLTGNPRDPVRQCRGRLNAALPGGEAVDGREDGLGAGFRSARGETSGNPTLRLRLVGEGALRPGALKSAAPIFRSTCHNDTAGFDAAGVDVMPSGQGNAPELPDAA